MVHVYLLGNASELEARHLEREQRPRGGAAHVGEDLWAKAHRKPEAETSEWDKFTAIGIMHADTGAVAAQDRLGYTGTADWRACESKRKKMVFMCRTIGTVAIAVSLST